MKIDIENVFIGTINKCITYNMNPSPFAKCITKNGCFVDGDVIGHIDITHILYKKDAKLLKVSENRYVDLDTLNSVIDEFKVTKKIKGCKTKNVGDLILGTKASKNGCLFVDEATLVKYEPLEKIKKTTVKKLKKTMLMDARILGGIE